MHESALARPAARSRSSVLAWPGAYSLLQRLLGARRAYRAVTAEHLRVSAGERILDLGCGPGDILSVLPPVDYLGLDLSPRYLAAARRRHPPRPGRPGHPGPGVEFRQLDVAASGTSLPAEAPFDGALAVGLLHHLSDEGAHRALALAATALRPGGRLVTLDPARRAGQPRLARFLIGHDRGGGVRTPEAYRELARPHFTSVAVSVREDLARVPYTHAILECRP